MLEVHTAGSWLVLGKFLARSRQNLGKISARSRRNFASAGDEKLWGLKTIPREPKGGQRMTKSRNKKPKGSQREPKGRPKGAKRSQKGGQREPRGSPKRPKNDKKSKLFLRSVSGSLRANFGYPFWLHFGSILGANIGDFSC